MFVPGAIIRQSGVTIVRGLVGRARTGIGLACTLFGLLAGAASALTAQEDEERRLIVHAVNFEGNRKLDDLLLRAAISTSRSSWLARSSFVRWIGLGSREFLNELELRRDVVRLQVLYRRSGYPDATVDTLITRKANAVDVTFVIDEGEPMVVSSLTVTGGEAIVTRRRLMRDLPLRVGDPFDRLAFLAAADSVRSLFRNRGYPYVEIFRNFEEDREALTARVWYEVDPGPLARIDSVIVTGPAEIDAGLVRRTLTFRPGHVYSQVELRRSQRDLYQLGVFDYVNVALRDSVFTGTGDTLVTVEAQVSEGRLHRVRAGFGYGTLDCFRTITSWTVRDFLGGGRSLELSARLSKIGSGDPFNAHFDDNVCAALGSDESEDRRDLNYNLQSALRFPYVFSPNNSASIVVTGERRSEINAYLRQSVGVQLAFTRETRPFPITFSYTLSRGRTTADPATFCSLFNLCSAEDRNTISNQYQRQSVFGASLIRNRTNSPINPSRGHRATVDLRYSSDALGSSEFAQFFKWVGEVSAYHPVSRWSVFAWRIRIGGILDDDFSFGTRGQDTRFIPTEERFYVGGPNSVRGFRQNELGPVVRVVDQIRLDTIPVLGQDSIAADTTFIVSPTGGNQLLLANAELRFPLTAGRINGALFVDVGQVFIREDTFAPFTNLRVTPGVGIRFLTPIGPLRLDLAVNPHDPERGQLYTFDGSDVTPVPGQEEFAPSLGSGPFRRLRLNFSIGEAF